MQLIIKNVISYLENWGIRNEKFVAEVPAKSPNTRLTATINTAWQLIIIGRLYRLYYAAEVRIALPFQQYASTTIANCTTLLSPCLLLLLLEQLIIIGWCINKYTAEVHIEFPLMH